MVVGAQGRNRTTDTGIFSPLLYRLSYLGLLRRKWARRLPSTGGKVNCEDLETVLPLEVALQAR